MEKSFSFTSAPGSGDNIAVNLASFRLGKYLEECEANRPEVANTAKQLLQEGKYYRKQTRDQKNRPTLLTVYTDRDYILHIVTNRNETCTVCEGTGTRAKPFENVTRRVGFRLRCLACDGKGYLPHYTTEHFFTLSPEDFENPEEGRAVFANKAYAQAQPGTEEWVERLSSADPRERLAACRWLDENYVREGVFFQNILPMLKKARYYEENKERKLLVWQFWAGKDIPEERKLAYYRIYADSKSGKVTRKGFFP
ncbi:MAG: hypothetical protein LBU79_05260 [Planctomycetota bacterium]|nr:hypothetical protein [Planctomycetota bacterium]